MPVIYHRIFDDTQCLNKTSYIWFAFFLSKNKSDYKFLFNKTVDY